MGRILDTLKRHEPGIYWLAVDLAGRGRGSAAIKQAIMEEVELANEARASEGKQTLQIDVWEVAV